MAPNTESGPARHDGESIFEILGSSSNPLPSSSSQSTSVTTFLATSPPPAEQTFHLFPELPLEIRRMIWNFALPKHFIPIRTIELSNTTKVPIEGTKSVDRTKTSVMLLTSPDELLDDISQLVASFNGDIGAAKDADAREKALNDMLEKRVFRRTFDDLNLVSWDVLTNTIISRLSANSQYASSAIYQRYISNTRYREGLRLVCKESYHELSRGLESTLGRVFSDEAVVFNDVHKSVTRMTGIPGAGRASTQNRANFFFPSPTSSLSDKPTAHFARDLETQKGALLAPGIKFHPGKSTLLFQGTLNTFFESCLSCPTPSTGLNLGRTPSYTTTYENIKYLAVEQDPRDLMNVSYAPRNYGARLDGLEELTFILEREKVERKGDEMLGLHWREDAQGAQAVLGKKTRTMIEGWGFGAPKRCKVMIAREFWGT